VLAIVSLLIVWPLAAHAGQSNQAKFVQALDRMMVSLGSESARDSKAIRDAYKSHLDLLVLDKYDALKEALSNGGLAPLPSDPRRFNLAPRLAGPFPIGEKDLENQVSYIAARPATIGALLDIASRVKSGPLEITSLVRHTEYQGALRTTNSNATTSLPMHTMGLAFDIALINTPLETVYEIRDVLRAMRKAGEILFVGERRQLVFHVVPHPSRLGRFTDVYTQALGAPPATGAAPVVAFSPVPGTARPSGVPNVRAEVVAVVPSSEFADEWWAADHAHGDLVVEVAPEPVVEPTHVAPEAAASAVSPPVLFLGIVVLLGVAGQRITRRPVLVRLFHSVEEEHATA
jgi:hypothetical protein